MSPNRSRMARGLVVAPQVRQAHRPGRLRRRPGSPKLPYGLGGPAQVDQGPCPLEAVRVFADAQLVSRAPRPPRRGQRVLEPPVKQRQVHGRRHGHHGKGRVPRALGKLRQLAARSPRARARSPRSNSTLPRTEGRDPGRPSVPRGAGAAAPPRQAGRPSRGRAGRGTESVSRGHEERRSSSSSCARSTARRRKGERPSDRRRPPYATWPAARRRTPGRGFRPRSGRPGPATPGAQGTARPAGLRRHKIARAPRGR